MDGVVWTPWYGFLPAHPLRKYEKHIPHCAEAPGVAGCYTDDMLRGAGFSGQRRADRM